jgi:hypothetical protein
MHIQTWQTDLAEYYTDHNRDGFKNFAIWNVCKRRRDGDAACRCRHGKPGRRFASPPECDTPLRLKVAYPTKSFFAGSHVWHSNTAFAVLFSARSCRVDDQNAGSIARAGFLRTGLSLIEAATMSHTLATNKLTASSGTCGLFGAGRVYGKINWIAWILPSKLGNGKNAGG